MVIRRCLIVLCLLTSFAVAQDTIRGSYSYTYGDSESLVEARQTCKDLAIREAIESYYIFVESSTEVESFQMKEDLIQSIAAGFIQNINIVEQKEEGRTLSISIEASVMPEDVKQLVQKLLEKRESDEQSDEKLPPVDTDNDSQTVVLTGDSDKNVDSVTGSRLSLIFNDYQNKWKPVQSYWKQNNYGQALKKIQEMKSFLQRRNPDQKNHFYYYIYQALWNHMMLADELLRLDYLESKGRVVRAKKRAVSASRQSDKLSIALKNLANLDNLSQNQKSIRTECLTHCQPILKAANSKVKAYRKK